MKNPIISIIVAIYNVEDYLIKCLDSLLGQTFKEIEIILVDDGSTDSCGSICDEYLKKDNRVRVIHQENGGLASARNAGLITANGKYIGFVDSDDWVVDDMFEHLYNISVANDADISICGHYVVDGNIVEAIRNDGKISVLEHDEALAKILLDVDINSFAWDKLYKKKLFSNLSYPIGRIFEDISFTYKLIDRSDKIVQVNLSKYFYLRRQGSYSLQVNPLNQLHSFYGFHERYLFALIKPEFRGILPYLLKKTLLHSFNAINGLILTKNYSDRNHLIDEFYKSFVFYKDVKREDVGFLYFLKTNLIIRMRIFYGFLYPYYHKLRNL